MTIRTALRLALSAILGTAAIAAADTTYLPGAAELTGLAGARFSSTLELSNPGATGTTATIGLVPMAGKAAPAPVARTLAAGESLRIPEALKTLFGLAEGAAGTLTLTSDEPLLANLSTRNVAAPEGAYGLGLLPVPSSDLLGAGETGHSIWVSQSADPAKGYRTNLSVTLVDPGTIVEVRVLDAEGRVAGAATVTAETAQVWQQPAASLIGFATDLPVGRAEFEVKAGRATAYAVVNDNVTSDAIALQVERVVPGPTDRLISGAALAPGQLGAFWSTDLRLFNPGSTAVDATIQSVGASREGSAVVPVPAKGVVEVSRALALLGFPEGTACALRVRAGASLLVAARTNNVDPAGIRKGTFSAQQFVTSWPAGLLGAGALGFFNGVDQSFNVPGVRTNLTVVGGPEGAAGELVLRDSAGLEHGRRAFARGPGEWGQQSVAEWFAPATVPGNSRVDVAVASGALDAFVSRIDNGSGDAITRPVALLGGGDCTKVVIASLDAEPKPIAAGVPTTFSWTVVLDPPAAELTSQSIRFDGEPEIELGKEIRSYVRSFDAAAARSATLTVRKGSCVKTRSLTFFVCGPLSLEPTTLPDATAFVVYPPRTITVPGATPPTTFTVAAGALPDGMSLSAAGELSGKPEEVGLFTFTVKAVDANGCVGTREYALRVFCPTLRIVPTTLPAGTVATPYTSIRFTVTGGSGTGTWSATGLPPGLALSTGGQLSGTPTAAGNYTVAVRFRDSSGCIGTASYTVLVCNTLVLTPGTLPAATAGTPYGPVPFNAAGATGAATWAVTTGSLPAGVTLNAGTGALSGTPTVVGTFPFTVTATDTLGCTGSVAVSLLVNCPVITVNPASLANGTAGVAYGPVSLSQTGGLGTVTYAVTAGALPAGTSLSAAGVLSGAPTVTGTFNFTVTATDVNGCTGTRAYTLTIACPVISLSPASLANGTAGVAFGPVALTQTGGVGAVSYAVTAGALPAGMTLGAAGVLGGTPTVVGPFGFTVTATDANGCTGTRAYSLTVDCPVINVNPVSVANGTAGVAYPGATFTQTGGVGTITWSLAAGTLPAGMSLAAGSGLLSGTPTVTGGFPITVRATDANGCFGERVLTLTIVCPTINVSPASLSNGTAGVVYPGATFTQTGGVGTIAWSLAAGTLPTGLSLNPVSGLLSGTPLQTGAFPITVRATDANGCTGDRALTLTILCPTIVASPGSPLGGIEGSVFGPIAFNQTGAVGAVAWTSTGTLPAGLTFSAAGVLTGTPAAGSAGSYTVTFTVTDQNLCQGSVQITFRICPVVTVGPNPLAAFLQSQLYAETLAGAGGVAPYTFAVTAGTLPAGVTLTGATGALSGTPTTLEAYDFTITATDTNGCTGSRQYTGRVCPVITVTTNLPNGVVGAAYSQTLAAAGSPDVPYAFSLTGGALPDGVTLVAGALTGNPTTPGSFTFTITATDTNGCAGSRTYIVEVCLAPTITPTPASVCALSTGNTASGPAGATTYAWVIANGTITSATNLQTVTYTAGASGNVALTLTVTSASSCSSSTSLNVPINANPATPTITGVPPGGVCADSTGNTASGPAGATTYAWSITGGTITSATNLQTVTYTAGPSGSVNLTLVVTNASGCSATNNATAAINANPATPTITGVPPGGVCADSTGNTASGPAGATTYSWSITGGTITSATNAQAVTYTAGASGSVNLTLVVTNGSGCSATSSATATINANPATPTITGVPTGGVCADSTGNTASGPAGATTYAWSITGGTITSAANLQTVTYTAGPSGSVNLTLVVTNASGCSATNNATAAINANPATPTITGVPPGGVCADSTGNTASGPAGATTYSWSITGGTITSATNAQAVTYTAGASGSVNLTLVVMNGSGCSATSSATATINANPATPTITGVPPGGVCADSTGNTASGPAGATTYAWSITGGTITSATNAQAVTYTAGASGSVNLTLVVTNGSGCSATSSATATINANPATPTITGVPPGGVCADSTGNTASGPAGATTYSWSITGGTITSATNAQAVTYTAGASGSVNLTLVVTNGSGCSATSSATATINANPATPTITGVPPGGVCADSTGTRLLVLRERRRTRG
ncbi:MAG: putative Ig domain-containing protein [Holophagales bacterium]|nr:putative Ig domain-containing protein [Holophagales bacterium]